MAVERLTDYTRRIWTALGPDAPEGHDIHVNDVIYYMDSSECCIVRNVYPDGSIDCETLPDIGGGGGGDDPYIIGRAILENNITEYIDPELTVLKNGALQNCTTLQTFRAPALVQLGQQSLQGTTALGPVAFPSLTSLTPNNVGQYCLAGTHAPVIDFGPNFQVKIGSYQMQNATTSTLIYRKNGIVALQSTTAMPSPFQSSGTGGTLYVPASKIAGYQAATNWSVMLAYEHNQILPIEGSIYETQYADGTPVV